MTRNSRCRIGSCRLLLALTCGAGLWAGCESREDRESVPSGQTLPPSKATIDLPAEPPATRPAGMLPRFRMIGAEQGIDFERYDDMRGQHRIIEANGGGVALFDFDRDGWPDVFFVNGCPVPAGMTDPEYRGKLFHNREGQRFNPVTESSQFLQYGYSCGCAVGDFDADGFDDLYITAFGRNALWRNNGDGTFSDVTEETGTGDPNWGTSAAFGDVDRDGDLDLYVVNYLDESAESPRLCPHEKSPTGYVSCSPALFGGVDDVLFLSDGSGGFVDATERCGLTGRKGKGLGVVISDLDGDLQPEVYVANDGEPNFLWVIDPGHADDQQGDSGDSRRRLLFEDRALISGTALNESGFAQASMGIAAGDYNNDGTIDLFLTHFIDDTNTLYANRGGLVFQDVTRTSQLAGSSRTMLSFGTVFLDADNDGMLDLFVANGHVDDLTWLGEGEPYKMSPQLYRNAGTGTFEDISFWSGDYFRKQWIGRGAASGDLNRDGRMDLAVSHQLSPSVLLPNETPVEHQAIVLRLAGTLANRNGYGTRAELSVGDRTFIRELTPGVSFQSACVPELHFGLGTMDLAELRINWPSGRIDIFPEVTSGHFVAVEGGGLFALP